jgi:hypothetical protein
MSLDYMSYKDAGANQTDDYRDRFNHLMDYSLSVENARLIAGLCCKSVSSGGHNGFNQESAATNERRGRNAHQRPRRGH